MFKNNNYNLCSDQEYGFVHGKLKIINTFFAIISVKNEHLMLVIEL